MDLPILKYTYIYIYIYIYIYVYWLTNIRMSMFTQENVVYEFFIAFFFAGPAISGSSDLNCLWDGRQVAIQLLFTRSC